MKKTVTVNLNGRVFTMDEDAYQLLDVYLKNLRIHFRNEEGSAEIIADFEARIEELLSEKLRLGYEVITLVEVEEVIARVGRPGDFSDEDSFEERREEQTAQPLYAESRKKFFRNINDKMFGGVCSGIGAYFGWDVLAVRIIMVILLFATQFLIVPLYLLAWLLFPAAKTAEEKLRMQGKPITVENIGKTVAAEADSSTKSENRGCLAGFLDFFVGFLKVCLVGLGLLVGIPLLFALFIIIVVLFALIFGVGGGLLALFSFGPFNGELLQLADTSMLTTVSLVIVLALPLIALIYAIIAHFARLKPLHKAVKWVCLVIWIAALVTALVTGIRIEKGITWERNYRTDSPAVEGNGVLADAEYVVGDKVQALHVGKYLWTNLQLEQISGDSCHILVSGDENLVDKVKYRVSEGKMYLTTHNDIRLQSNNNLIVKVQAPDISSLKIAMLGNVNIPAAYKTDRFELKMEGAGRFQGDSLFVNSILVKSEGIGSITLGGRAVNADMRLEGAGEINAFDFRSDSICARVEGVGSIQCDPVKYLKGDVNGIGKITYRTEPETKVSGIAGMGKIGAE